LFKFSLGERLLFVSPKGSLNSDGQQFHQYQQNNNNLSPKESLNSDGQQLFQN
jgi:hypothetical protein